MKKAVYNTIFICSISVFLIGCKGNTMVKYEQQDQLLTYLYKQHIDVAKKTLLIILQKELCSCTADDTELSYEILTSPKYNTYNKVLIVPDNTHSIIARLDKTPFYRNIIVIQNINDNLKKNGLTFAVNRLFMLDQGGITRIIDMHLTKHQELRTELL